VLGLGEVGFNVRSPGGLRTVLAGSSRARRQPRSRWWWMLVPLLLLGLLLAWLLGQPPHSVAEAELSGSRSPTPIGILLLLDESGSFQQYRGIRDQALADALQWCAQPNNLNDDDTITVVAFTNHGLVRMPSTRVADIRAGKARLDSTPLPGDSTEVQPALKLAASAVDSSMPQSLIAVTDTAVYDLDAATVEPLVRALNVISMSLIAPEGVKVEREWSQLFGYEYVVRASSDSARQTSLAVAEAVAHATGQALRKVR
jgi:von Willebrand factor type A domain